MSTYHSIGELPDGVDVAYDMIGRDIRLSIPGDEAFDATIHLSIAEATAIAQTLQLAVDAVIRLNPPPKETPHA